ncbi:MULTISPECIES: hypothetical protein [unclassified Phyllobacterium]|uniref:hypothetical protein n=1 Tax=unclassified Phyllobacterium TaxID=2638441 RepID=UPI003012D082
MPGQDIHVNKYSAEDWAVMEAAYKLAYQHIGHIPQVKPNRLARSNMTFFDGGMHSAGILSSLAMNREMSLVDAARARGSTADNDDIIAGDEALYFDWKTLEWKDSTTN